MWLDGRFPASASRETLTRGMRAAQALLLDFPEVRGVVAEIGQSDSGLELADATNVHFLVLLRAEKDRPEKHKLSTGAELQKALQTELIRKIDGVEWEAAEQCRDAFDTTFVAGPGAHLLKITGPDLKRLEETADRTRNALRRVTGIDDVCVSRIAGRAQLMFRVDREKCAKFGITTADVKSVIEMAAAGKSATSMIEGEKLFDITPLWPLRLRANESAILDIPVDLPGELPKPGDPIKNAPRLRLRDLVSPLGADGQPDPDGQFTRPGIGAIYRENGKRMISLRFQVRGQEGAAALSEAKKKLAPLVEDPYRAEWESGR
jgi:cobalt-zinc-cadmium resistance protein CzcA